ncbi:MAG TPA: GH1 family beta-glucosidase [Candidatus Krumholzibacteria bacterium]|nr:GH1 family beta-glucosidase [Candidatus Krumholzibacteria bacterium]HPD70567.1 GH1 family beta-glucosidase [Candidatus Krumholzibacteria bacterium]HRY39733.1 GH1 family beta-glucosidase [Candidatus Krumholzibacteria bacterium]
MSAFPPGFLWGAATSAYQIEGSPLADGAGPSNWHVFSHTPGKTARGETGDLACDHYRRFGEDVRLMQELGLGAYRFSLAWSRVLPDGTGRVNERGLDFYDRLVDQLLAARITPFATLFHWDWPAALDERGGWVHPDSAHWFADYAQVVWRRLGDRVAHWTTLNEPWVVMDAGYVHGVHAPGHASLAEAPRVAHNLLRAHGTAVQAYRALPAALRAGGAGQIGIVVNLEPKDAASEAAADLAAARRADAYMNRYFLDALCLGRYPDELAEIFGAHWPQYRAGDPAAEFALIGEPIDFLGINYYMRSVNRHDPSVPPVFAAPVKQAGADYTDLGWEVHPESLRRVLAWVTERYGKRPLYVTENGAAYLDPAPVAAGRGPARVADPRRVAYLRSHLAAMRDAMRQGADVRGYFVWSLLDNYEWACGYAMTLGIVAVDRATQARVVKDSGWFYRNVIARGGV